MNNSSGELVSLSSFCWGLLGLWLVLVKVHESVEIELWLLEDLSLSHHAVVLKWVDLAALLLDLFANLFFNKDLDEFLQG